MPQLQLSDKAFLFFRHLAKKNVIIKKLFVTYSKRFRKWTNKRIREQSEEAISIFVPEEKRADADYLNKLRKELADIGFVYLISPSEYFLFDYGNLSESERLEFVGDYEKNWICLRTDKNKCYDHFKAYYKRDAIAVNGAEDRESYLNFISKYNGAIVKEASSTMGKDVQVVRNSDDEVNALWDRMNASFAHGSTYIVEELIHQSEEMAVFHPNSVNTVRMMTFKDKGEVALLGSFVRFGRGQSFVDNAGSGGIFAEVDTTTGKVIGSAITKSGEKFDVHPDSGVRINGFQIPKWNELVEFSIRLANELKVKKYVGWDCALTDQGWVMVEGNSHGQFVNQYPNKNGMRDRVRKYFYPVLGIKKDL